jgi:hypothetical protein
MPAGSIPADSTIVWELKAPFSAGLGSLGGCVECDSLGYGSLVMSESWSEIARRIESKPWNRPGADKTWVLNAMSTHLKFQEEIRKAKRIRTR